MGGGGRYDGLIKELGGPDTPAVGFALGIDRILLAGEGNGLAGRLRETGRLDAFLVDFAGGTAARDLTAQLRAAGFRVDRSFDGRSPKAQFKAADRSGARLAIIIGPDEATAGTAGIKDLLHDGAQESVPQTDLVNEIRRRLEPALADRP